MEKFDKSENKRMTKTATQRSANRNKAYQFLVQERQAFLAHYEQVLKS